MNRRLLSAVALILALLAALTLFLDGVRLNSSMIQPLQNQLDQYIGLAGYGGDMAAAMAGLSGEQAAMLKQSLKLIKLMNGAIRSGGLSVWECFRVLSAITVMYVRVGGKQGNFAYFFDMSDFKDQITAIVAVSVLLLLLLLGAAAALALAIRNMLRGRRNGSLLMVLVNTLALALCIALVQYAKSNSYGSTPMVITPWPVVGLALAIAGAAVGRLNPAGTAEPAPVGRPRRTDARRPESKAPSGGRRCPGCGKVYGPGTAFCGVCGLRLDSVEAKATSSAGFCGRCGAPARPGQRFCGKCGGAL